MENIMANVSKNFKGNSSMIIYIIGLLILLYILLKLLFILLTYSYGKTGHDVLLVDGLLQGSRETIIKQNSDSDKLISRSVNQKNGIEFTYSIWLNIDTNNKLLESDDDLNNCNFSLYPDACGNKVNCTTSTEPNAIHIFSKGSSDETTNNTTDPSNIQGIQKTASSNGPGLYLAKRTNEYNSSYYNEATLLIYMDTFDIFGAHSRAHIPIIIDEVPLNKWVSVVMVASQSTIIVYINGKVKERKVYDNIFLQNYGDIHVNDNGAIQWGELSDLRYINRAISGIEVMQIVNSGPNLHPAMTDTTDRILDVPRYLNNKWFNP